MTDTDLEKPIVQEVVVPKLSSCRECSCPRFDYEVGDHPGFCLCGHFDSSHTLTEFGSGSLADHYRRMR